MRAGALVISISSEIDTLIRSEKENLWPPLRLSKSPMATRGHGSGEEPLRSGDEWYVFSLSQNNPS